MRPRNAANTAAFQVVDGFYRVELIGDAILGATQITLPSGQEVYPALDANHLGPGVNGRWRWPGAGRCRRVVLPATASRAVCS